MLRPGRAAPARTILGSRPGTAVEQPRPTDHRMRQISRPRLTEFSTRAGHCAGVMLSRPGCDRPPGQWPATSAGSHWHQFCDWGGSRSPLTAPWADLWLLARVTTAPGSSRPSGVSRQVGSRWPRKRQAAVAVRRSRESFQTAKSRAGLEECQVCPWTSQCRWITLVLVSLLFWLSLPRQSGAVPFRRVDSVDTDR